MTYLIFGAIACFIVSLIPAGTQRTGKNYITSVLHYFDGLFSTKTNLKVKTITVLTQNASLKLPREFYTN